MITSEEIIKKLEEALKQFGEYSYYDKGPHEVLDVDEIVNDLVAMSAIEAGQVLKEVAEHEHGIDLREAILLDMNDLVEEDDWLDECADASGIEELLF